MSKADPSASKVPDINLAGLKERMLLERNSSLVTTSFATSRPPATAWPLLGKNSNTDPRREREELNGKLAARWNILRLDRRDPYPV